MQQWRPSREKNKINKYFKNNNSKIVTQSPKVQSSQLRVESLHNIIHSVPGPQTQHMLMRAEADMWIKAKTYSFRKHRWKEKEPNEKPFSSRLQSFPASGSFPVSQLFPSGGQSIGGSASAVSPSNEYSGLISFRIDWFDLLAVQGTLKSLLQHHSSKATILPRSAFFMVQLSHPVHDYWKNHSFDYMDFCSHKWCLCFLICSLGLS